MGSPIQNRTKVSLATQSDVSVQHRIVGVSHRRPETLQIPARLARHGGECVAERVRVHMESNSSLEAIHQLVDAPWCALRMSIVDDAYAKKAVAEFTDE